MTEQHPSPDPAEDPAYELLGLLAEEFAEGGIDASLLPGDEEVPAQLMVPLVAEDGTSWTAHVCFLPDHAHPAVLQYLVIVDDDVRDEAVPTVARFLHQVNASLPLTGFELGETVSSVVFRYNQAVSVHPLDPGVVAWSLSMIHHAVTRFGPLVDAAGAGTSFPELVRGFGRAMAALYDGSDDRPAEGS